MGGKVKTKAGGLDDVNKKAKINIFDTHDSGTLKRDALAKIGYEDRTVNRSSRALVPFD